MREMFGQFVIRFCFAGLGATALIALVLATYPTVDERIGEPLGKAVRSRRISVLVPIVCVCGTILFAIDKGPVPTNAPAPRAQVRMVNAAGSISPAEEAAMAEADEGMSLIGNWFRSGAHDSELAVSFDGGWVFPYGSNHLSRIQIMAYGEVYADEMDPTPIAAISEELSCKPQTTRVYCGLTPDNSYRVEWREAYANNDLNQPMNAAIDLHRDGTVIITENGVTRTIDRELPFPHSGYGQDADWVKANFTNAAEIISVGYANWVDAQVGIGLTNGLYKFTATVTEKPLECSQLKVGDYSVAVTNAGEYVFLLEKGTGYEFGTWPYDESVDYFVQDDMAGDAPTMMPQWSGWGSYGEWSVDEGWNWLSLPYVYSGSYYDGICSWMPSFRGCPDLNSGEPMSFPRTFSVSFDYPGSDRLTYYWTASDPQIRFSSPHSKSTMVFCDHAPRWGELELSVSTRVGGVDLSSTLTTLYGTNAVERLGVSCCCPEYLDTYRSGDSLMPVTFIFNSPKPTNGVIRALGWSSSGISLYYDREGWDAVPDLFEEPLVGVAKWRRTLYAKCGYPSETIGDEMIACYFADGREFSRDDVAEVHFSVVDRISEPVLSRRIPNGDLVRYFNPCCALPETEVHLCVSVQPSALADNEIVWRCVSGDAAFVSSPMGREVVVRMGLETAVFEIGMPDILPGVRPLRLTVHVLER